MLVADEFVFRRVIVELAAEEQRDIGGMAGYVRLASHFGIGARLTARLHAIKKVADMKVSRVSGNFGTFPDEQGG